MAALAPVKTICMHADNDPVSKSKSDASEADDKPRRAAFVGECPYTTGKSRGRHALAAISSAQTWPDDVAPAAGHTNLFDQNAGIELSSFRGNNSVEWPFTRDKFRQSIIQLRFENGN